MLYNIQCVYPDSDIEYVYPNKDTFRFCQYYTYHYIYSIDTVDNAHCTCVIVYPISMLCQIVVGPQFQNFMSLCCLFPWSQGF